MTPDPLTLLVAIAVPAVGLLALIGVVAGLRGIERSRDELNELGSRR